MELNSLLIIKLLLGLGVTILIARVIGNFFSRFMDGPIHKRSEELDIDEMIERKKAFILGNLKNENPSIPVGQNFRQELMRLKSDPTELEALQIYRYFDEASWGDGSLTKGLISKLNQKINYVFQKHEISQTIIEIGKLEAPSKISFELFERELINLFILTKLVYESKSNAKGISDKLGERFRSNGESVVKAIISFLNESSGINSDQAVVLTLKRNPPPHSASALTIYLNLFKRDPNLTIDLLLDKIKRRSILIKNLVPLPAQTKRGDLDWACAILELPEDATLDEIKKRFKELAALAHPDKIGQIKSPDLIAIANSNFNLIKEAYEILKKSGTH